MKLSKINDLLCCAVDEVLEWNGTPIDLRFKDRGGSYGDSVADMAIMYDYSNDGRVSSEVCHVKVEIYPTKGGKRSIKISKTGLGGGHFPRKLLPFKTPAPRNLDAAKRKAKMTVARLLKKSGLTIKRTQAGSPQY
jgi:hypothetical protein